MKIVKQENNTELEITALNNDLVVDQSGDNYIIVDRQGAKELIKVLEEFVNE